MREGITLIKKSEGFKAKAYLCPAGIPTFGYGETRGVKLGMVTTLKKAEEDLIVRYDEFEAGVLKLVKVKLTNNQLGALVSFAYNLGLGNLKSSRLLFYVNTAKIDQAANSFSSWVYGKVKGKTVVLPGLVIRREAEKALFLKPDNQ